MKDGSSDLVAKARSENNVQLPPGIRIPGLFFFAYISSSLMKEVILCLLESILIIGLTIPEKDE